MRLLAMACALGLGVGVGAASASAATEPAPRKGEAITLDAEASAAVRGFLSTLERDLLNAAKDKAAARQKLVDEAPLGPHFASELQTWLQAVEALDGVRRVRLTGFEVHGATWYGLLDTHEVELFFWVTDKHTRLLRMQARDGSLSAFGHTPWPAWLGQPAEAFGALADQTLRTATEGGCASLPMVGAADWKAVLPKSKAQAAQTRAYLERMVDEARATCDGLVGSPWHRLTWRLGDVAGVVEGKRGEKLSFRLTLVNGAARDVRVYHISKPVGPTRKKPGE